MPTNDLEEMKFHMHSLRLRLISCTNELTSWSDALDRMHAESADAGYIPPFCRPEIGEALERLRGAIACIEMATDVLAVERSRIHAALYNTTTKITLEDDGNAGH